MKRVFIGNIGVTTKIAVFKEKKIFSRLEEKEIYVDCIQLL